MKFAVGGAMGGLWHWIRGLERVSRRWEGVVAVAAALLTLNLLLSLQFQLQFVSLDQTMYYLPWYEHIVHFGRWPSIEGSYANYTPPYLYILSLFTHLQGHLAPLMIVKLASVPFMFAIGALFWSICRAAGCSQRLSLLAAWIALVAPEIDSNTLMTGQCDVQSTTFILLFLRFLMARRPTWAMTSLGIALSMKLQPIFVGPLVVVLLLTGEVPWASLLAIPLSYLLMMTPAALAGRPWKELLGIYSQQYGLYQEIAMNAANPYIILLRWVHSEPTAVLIAHIGLLFGGLATLTLVVFLWRARVWSEPRRLIAGLGLTLVLEPYILPKMHDRYFFAGNTIVLILATIVPRMAIPAILLQKAALMSYFATDYGPQRTRYWVPPVLMVGVAIYLLVKQLAKPAETSSVLSEASLREASAVNAT